LQLVNLKDSKSVDTYILPYAKKLMEYKMCDGYLFSGVYEENSVGNKKNALRLYQEGSTSCKVYWKKFELLSRMNRMKYQLNMFGKK